MEPIEIPAADLREAGVPEWRRVRLTGGGPGVEPLSVVVAYPEECPGGVVCSYWRPTPSERAAIAAGEPVMLQVVTSVHRFPPVALLVRKVDES